MLRKGKNFRGAAALLCALLVSTLIGISPAGAESNPVLSELADKAANYLYNEFVKNGAKNEDVSVGSYAAYILTEAEVDLSTWVREGTSLRDAVINLVYQDITNSAQASAKVLAQDLLVAEALNRDDLTGELLQLLKNKETSTSSAFDANLFSDVPAYEILGRAGRIGEFVYARDYLLSTQNVVYATVPEAVYESVYGSWGFFWGGEFYPDFMTTAQAVRVLACLDPNEKNQEVQAAIDLGLAWLKKQQQSDGSFVSGWDDPLLDTVEMIATLQALGENPSSLQSSEKKSPVDYLTNNALNQDGSFGTFGNAMDATWALWGYHLLGGQVQNQLFLEPTKANLSVGEKVHFKALLQDTSGSKFDVTQNALWSVDDTGIAGVASGLVTGLKAGTTVVRAAYGGLRTSAELTVKSPVQAPGSTNTCLVGIAVVGMNGEPLFGPGYVLVSKDGIWGLTAMGALDATGLPYTMSTSFPDFVESISGQANSGMSGWCYTVNESIPPVAASKYSVKEGDKVIWYYSKDMNAAPPKWEDLVKQQISGAVPAAETLKSVENALSDLQGGKINAGQAISIVSEAIDKLKESEVTKELKEKLSEAVRTFIQALAKIPEKALASQAEGEKISVKIDGDLLKEQVGAVKRAADLAEKLQKIEVTEATGLIRDGIMVELPDTFANKDTLTVIFSANAGQEVANAGLNFALREKEVSFVLPPEALKAVLEAPSISQVEISVQKIDAARFGLFEGGSPVTQNVLDIEVSGVTLEGKREKPVCFPKKLTVTLSLEGADLDKVDLNRLAVYRKKKDGSWEFVGGRPTPDAKSFIFEADRLSLYALAEFKKTFQDTADHWAREAIELLAKRLVIQGIGKDLFAPDERVTRIQFAALLTKALGLEEQSPEVQTFRDVLPTHWGYQAVSAAFRAGLISGTGGGKFEPERFIKREEMAAMLAKLLEKQGIGVKPTSQGEGVFARYSDSKAVSDWARDGVAMCVTSGIMRGRSATVLAPKDTATRAEAVVLFQNLLELLGEL